MSPDINSLYVGDAESCHRNALKRMGPAVVAFVQKMGDMFGAIVTVAVAAVAPDKSVHHTM